MADKSANPGSRRAALIQRAIAEGGVVLAILGWWSISKTMPSFVLPGPSDVAVALWKLFSEPALVINTVATTLRVIASVALALAGGLALALVARMIPDLEWVILRRLQPLLNSFPSIGWAILAVIWFDVSTFSVLFVQVVILLPFCLINLSAGLDEIDQEVVEMGRSFTRSSWRNLTKLYLPLLMPYLIAALRISYGVCWKLALVAELFGANSGLGYVMVRAQYTANNALVLATCVAIVLLFIAGEKLIIDPLARRFAGPRD